VNCKRAQPGVCTTVSQVSSADVCAMIYCDRTNRTAVEVVSAAEGQSCRPGLILTAPGPVPRESAFAAGVRAARARGCRWLWLLDGWAVPEPGALEALLAASEAAAAPTPLLLASKVVDRQGRLHSDATPRHEILEKAHSVDAVERRLVQLRAAAHGSVLVSGAEIDRFGPPRSDLPPGLDMHEWSARMLRSWQDTGYLVPASVAVRDAPPLASSCRHSLGRVRVLASSAWSPRERLWEAFLLGRDAARALPRHGNRQGRAGVGAPGRNPSRSPRRMIGIVDGANRWRRR
jgi:hypothetical protein